MQPLLFLSIASAFVSAWAVDFSLELFEDSVQNLTLARNEDFTVNITGWSEKSKGIYYLDEAPLWMKLDFIENRIFGRVPLVAENSLISINATDGQSVSTIARVNLKVSDVSSNRDPVVVGQLNLDPPNVVIAKNDMYPVDWKFAIPDLFQDPDGDELTLHLEQADGRDLPGWISFDSQTREISAKFSFWRVFFALRSGSVSLVRGGLSTADDTILAFMSLNIISQDGRGGSASLPLSIPIVLLQRNSDDRPAIICPGEMQEIPINQLMTFSLQLLPMNAHVEIKTDLKDADEWIKWDRQNQQLIGYPKLKDVGHLNVEIIVSTTSHFGTKITEISGAGSAVCIVSFYVVAKAEVLPISHEYLESLGNFSKTFAYSELFDTFILGRYLKQVAFKELFNFTLSNAIFDDPEVLILSREIVSLTTSSEVQWIQQRQSFNSSNAVNIYGYPSRSFTGATIMVKFQVLDGVTMALLIDLHAGSSVATLDFGVAFPAVIQLSPAINSYHVPLRLFPRTVSLEVAVLSGNLSVVFDAESREIVILEVDQFRTANCTLIASDAQGYVSFYDFIAEYHSSAPVTGGDNNANIIAGVCIAVSILMVMILACIIRCRLNKTSYISEHVRSFFASKPFKSAVTKKKQSSKIDIPKWTGNDNFFVDIPLSDSIELSFRHSSILGDTFMGDFRVVRAQVNKHFYYRYDSFGPQNNGKKEVPFEKCFKKEMVDKIEDGEARISSPLDLEDEVWRASKYSDLLCESYVTFGSDAAKFHWTANIASTGDPLPLWLRFNPINCSFYGIPADSDKCSWLIEVKLFEEGELKHCDTFKLCVI